LCYTWRSNSFGAAEIPVHPTDPNFSSGYYIGVYGGGNGKNSFGLVASLSDASNAILNL
jgi:hypothetical protein